jgi:cytochrome d ubiquinol oxidase subunit I
MAYPIVTTGEGVTRQVLADSPALMTVAFRFATVGAVGALHLLRNKSNAEARKMFSMAMWMLAIVAPLQVVAGDFHGVNTYEHQPVKIMAMEGHYESHPEGAPLYLFGIPNEKEQRLDYAIGIPKLSSLIIKHDLNAPMKGLDTVPDELQPPVPVVFWSFRIMVGLGMLMVLAGVISLFLRWRKRLYDTPLFHRFAMVMGPTGFVAVLAGWITTEVGRQPYTVYGHLKTIESIAPVEAPAVAASLIAFIIVYFILFGESGHTQANAPTVASSMSH